MNRQYSHIQNIRSEFGLKDKDTSKPDRTKECLQEALKKLSEGLYSKKTHFLLELIQNAEDNEYSKEPRLSIKLLKKDPTGTCHSDGAILIQNNEKGFTEENMDALCAVGKTTKTKISGYIGEKGIGFKSVFVITTSPYIFSKGYYVRFPEKIKGIDLGYIIPEWVEEIPKIVDPSQTNIILPLDKADKMDFKSISNMMREFTPETILFLNKLTTLNLTIEDEYNIEITKVTNKDNLITLIRKGKDGEKEIDESVSYLLYNKTYKIPSDLEEIERKGINDSTISLAFPVNKRINQCALYAYLPVWENTGLPFIINADFLLTSSRTDIYDEKEWNIWLRDHIIDLYISALDEMVKNPAYIYSVLNYIPLHTDNKFLNPMIDCILSKLKDKYIIATEPDNKLVQPKDAHNSFKFRNLLDRKIYPEALINNRLIRQEIQEQSLSEVWDKLGIKSLDRDVKIACFKDKDWIGKHNFEWILDCYAYLKEDKYEKEILRECPIVPIKTNNGYRYSCDKEQPIYFECSSEDREILAECSEYISQPIAFICDELLELIKEKDELKKWMTDFLGVNTYSITNYTVDVLDWFSKDFDTLSDECFVSVTKFIIENKHKDTTLENLPILLINSERIILQEIKNQKNKQLVSPIGYDCETGWQNIFVTDEDRQHLIILSDTYLKLQDGLEKFFDAIDATKYPKLRVETINSFMRDESYGNYTICNESLFNETEIENINSAAKSSAVNSRAKIYLERKVCPSSVKGKIDATLSNSLVKWLCNLASETCLKDNLSSVVYYFRYGQQPHDFDSDLLEFLKNSPWLPTTKGYNIPRETFDKNDEIEEILGDLVPYIQDALPKDVLNLLKINTSITTDKLISQILYYSDQNEDKQELIEKLYSLLYYRLQNSRQVDIEKQTKSLREKKSILVNSDETLWASPNECIWQDREDLFGNRFHYIGKLYPKLKDFFIKYLRVKEDVDDTHYATLWLKNQESTDIQENEIKKTMLQIMINLNNFFKRNYNNQDKPVWLSEFKQKALIYTENSRFVPPNEVFIPNDGKLKMIFKDTLDFTWIPETKNYNDFSELFSFLEVKLIKESVAININNTNNLSESSEPEYLTIATKKIIANWLKDKDEKKYLELEKNGTIECLFKTMEFNANEIMLRYSIGSIYKDYPSECFWDVGKNKLLLTSEVSKRHIADSLARELSNGTNYDEIKTFIEAKLCYSEQDLKYMLEEDNKSISPEIEEFFCSGRQINVPEIAYSEEKINTLETIVKETDNAIDKIPSQQIGQNQAVSKIDTYKVQETVNVMSTTESKQEATISEYNNKELNSAKNYTTTAIEEADKENINKKNSVRLTEYIFKTFNSIDKLMDEYANYTKRDKVYDPERRFEKEYESNLYNLKLKNNFPDRKRLIPQKLTEPTNELTKKSLQDWYAGKCQICGCDNNFIQSNGKPFFIIHYIIERSIDISSDNTGNALCLCANHFAQMIYGPISAADINEQFSQLSCDGKQEIKFNLCGEEVILKFHKEHIIAIQAYFAALNGL